MKCDGYELMIVQIKKSIGLEKNLKWLRALAALLADPGLSPRPHVAAHTVYNSSFRTNDTFYPPWVPHTCSAHAYI